MCSSHVQQIKHRMRQSLKTEIAHQTKLIPHLSQRAGLTNRDPESYETVKLYRLHMGRGMWNEYGPVNPYRIFKEHIQI